MTKTEMDEGTKDGLRKLAQVCKAFRSMDTEFPLQTQQVLLWVARNEGKTQREMIAALDMNTSTASRNIALLSPIHRLGKPGHGLITWLDDSNDRRQKFLVLTEKGRAFIDTLCLSNN